MNGEVPHFDHGTRPPSSSGSLVLEIPRRHVDAVGVRAEGRELSRKLGQSAPVVAIGLDGRVGARVTTRAGDQQLYVPLPQLADAYAATVVRSRAERKDIEAR